MELSGQGYLCAAGESFDSIAGDLYGDEVYAAELMSANPEHCRAVRFRGGEVLYLPEMDIPDRGENPEDGVPPADPPWKQTVE